ncbi:MAG: response regulator [Gemmatimonadota bacterium]
MSPDRAARIRFLGRLDARITVLDDSLQALAQGDEEAATTIRRIARLLEGAARRAGFLAIEGPAAEVAGASGEELPGRVEALLGVLRGIDAANVEREHDRRILVVEENREIAHLVTVLLSTRERTVERVQDGAGALAHVGNERPDLVILDLVLPDTDGRKLLLELRERTDTSEVPVVVLAPRMSSRVRSECLALGADACFEKPVDAQELVDSVESILRRADEEDRAAGMDPFTGLRSGAGIREAYDELEGDGVRTVAVLSIDGFEALDEGRGHPVTERVLATVADALVAALAAAEDHAVPGRWRNGEFVVLFSGGAEEELRDVVRELLEAVRRAPVRAPDRELFHVTASAALSRGGDGEGLDAHLEAARGGVDRARERGGNQLIDPEAEVGGERATILVAEDDPVAATLLTHRLRKEGYEVRHFENGRDAHRAALDQIVDLVILDVRMPGMGGFELLGRLRRVPAYQGVPIILLTSMGSEDDLVRGFDLGADDYVLKPFSPTELVARVRRLLKREPTRHRA